MLNTVLSMAIMAIYSMVIALLVIIGIQDGISMFTIITITGAIGSLVGLLGANIYR